MAERGLLPLLRMLRIWQGSRHWGAPLENLDDKMSITFKGFQVIVQAGAEKAGDANALGRVDILKHMNSTGHECLIPVHYRLWLTVWVTHNLPV